MKKKIFLSSSLILFVLMIILSCNETGKKNENDNVISKDSLQKRGEYLVSIMGCDDCHTPKKMGPMGPEPDMDLRFSGYRSAVPFPKVDTNIIKSGWALVNPELTGWAGPWGASFAANISSDETGIGNWSEAQFKKAITEGKWKGMDGNRTLLPPMPWQSFKNLTDIDLKAIYTFLESSRPVKNIEPSIKPFASL